MEVAYYRGKFGLAYESHQLWDTAFIIDNQKEHNREIYLEVELPFGGYHRYINRHKINTFARMTIMGSHLLLFFFSPSGGIDNGCGFTVSKFIILPFILRPSILSKKHWSIGVLLF
jgi:hypothetical protein